MARGPKSHKADGSPKKRWSADQRAAAGRKPRRRGGQTSNDQGRGPRTQRDGRDQRGDSRGQWRRDERGDRDFGRPGRFEDRDQRRDRRDDRFDDRGPRGGNRRDDRGGNRSDRYDDRRPKRFDDRYDDRRPHRRDDSGDRRYGRQGGKPDRRPREDRYDDRRRDDRFGNDRFDERRGGDRPRKDSRFDDRRGDQRPRRWDERGGESRPKSNSHRRGERRFDDRGGDRRGGRFEDRGPKRRFDDRGPRFDRRDDGHAPEQDQMEWRSTEVEGLEGVTNGFNELGVADEIVSVLAAQDITEPFPIQAATIRDAISGRDVLGRARTGSGKTLAFGLPLLTKLAEGHGPGPRAVILSPTRELALQIADNLSPLAAAVRLDLTLIAGGMSYGPQIRAFERGVDVVVATPGRLVDLMEQGVADLSRVEITVLDEADHMADMGFTEELTAILDATPAGGQRLLFSATLDDAVARIVDTYLDDPLTHEVDSGQASIATMTHLALMTHPHHKQDVTAELASREGRTVVFARTQKGADRTAEQLRAAGVMAGVLHGGLRQGARARILDAFRRGDVPVLVATDVAARGIHVDDVSLVLQVDPPHDSKDYLHRAGRTARAGMSGVVATIVLPHQRKLMRRLHGQAGVDAPVVRAEPGSEELAELTGAKEPSHVPIDESRYQALISPKQQARKRRPRQGYRRR